MKEIKENNSNKHIESSLMTTYWNTNPLGVFGSKEEEDEYYNNREAYFAMEEEKSIPASFYRREWWEDTAFDPKVNYPRGVLQTVDVVVGEGIASYGEWSISFFPECSDVIHAQRFRSSVDCDEEAFKMGLSAYVNASTKSWCLDEISDGEASLSDSCKLKPREKYEKMWMKDDIEKIRYMMEVMEYIEYMEMKEHSLEMTKKLFREHPSVEAILEQIPWAYTTQEDFEEEGDKFFAQTLMHDLRAKSGPPGGEYYMCVERPKGRKWKEGKWEYVGWNPALGRTDDEARFQGYPEKDYSKKVNPEWNNSVIYWPKDMKPRGPDSDHLNMFRWSGLRSCGGWIEDDMDSEGRFVAYGVVKKVLSCGVAYVWTKYGEAVVPSEIVFKNSEFFILNRPIKMICIDHNVLEEWAPALTCKKVVPLDLYEQKRVWEWV